MSGSRWRDYRLSTTFGLELPLKLFNRTTGVWHGHVINFFTLRPPLRSSLKVVWYLYLLNTVVQTYTTVSGIFQVLAQRGLHVELWSPSS